MLTKLRDRRAQAKVLSRLDRLALGNLGDCKSLSRGVSELSIDHGPGYRVYFAMTERTCVLLLAGGDKRTQSRDIGTAIARLLDYRKRWDSDEKKK